MATPTFGTFGKTANNLLNLKFEANKDDFANQASIKTQSNAFAITSTAVTGDENKLKAKVNVKHADKQYGESSVEFNTAGKLKATFKLSKLQPGLVLSGEGELEGSDFGGKATAEYIQAPIASTSEYQLKKNSFQQTLAYGMDGVSIGGSVTTDISGVTGGEFDAAKHIKPDVGIQYEDGNLIGAFVFDAQKTSTFTLFHRVNPELQIASKFQNTTKGNTLAVGVQYKLSSSTVVKGKSVIVNDGSHSHYGYIQHRLGAPNVNVGVSATWNSNKTSAIGVNLEFGQI